MVSPTVKNLLVNGNALECDLLLGENDLCFEGHFPGFKVLPGVTQLHFVMLLAQEHLGVPATFSKIARLKFKSLVRPGQMPHLKMEKTETALNFSIVYEDKICAQGSFVQ